MNANDPKLPPRAEMLTMQSNDRGDELTPLLFTRLATPLGPMVAMAEERGLVLLEFVDRPALVDELADLRRHGYRPVPGRNAHLEQLAEELAGYFAGGLRLFTVPLHMPGTAFEAAVWSALCALPYATTSSYGEIAQRLGRPGAGRAVGRANGRNRIAIVVPCHRVVGADGSLTGYGGGKERKRYLIRLERRGVGGSGQPRSRPPIRTPSVTFSEQSTRPPTSPPLVPAWPQPAHCSMTTRGPKRRRGRL